MGWQKQDCLSFFLSFMSISFKVSVYSILDIQMFCLGMHGVALKWTGSLLALDLY